MESNTQVAELVERLGSEEDSIRKMAAFKLQSSIADPSFADVFIAEKGLEPLRYLTLTASGNTLAYSLTAFSRLLEVDKGWQGVNAELVKRVVELVVTHPLVNILRGAMSILVAIVSHPHTSTSRKPTTSDLFGFRALKPAIAAYPQFLEMLVNRLSSADHALCTNALQLINSIMRDAISTGSDTEWPRTIKRLQELGVIRAAYTLMTGTALQDLAPPLLEFQALTKVLLRKWRGVPVDFEKSDQRRALRGIEQASKTDHPRRSSDMNGHVSPYKDHDNDKWRRLGFSAALPAEDFEEVGFLGMMDLADFVRRQGDGFQKLLLEQGMQDPDKRCPIARASIAITSILYDHFEIDRADLEDAKGHLAMDDPRQSLERLFKPLLLQWPRLHSASLQALFRIWKSIGATSDDFSKASQLIRILVEAVVGGAVRTTELSSVENELQNYDVTRLRALQMELVELSYEDTWGPHLRHVRDGLASEALQFIKEQRIRCLLAGAWFPLPPNSGSANNVDSNVQANGAEVCWRYARLSPNRRWLHFGDFAERNETERSVDELPDKIDLSTVSSVVSNVSAHGASETAASSNATLRAVDEPDGEGHKMQTRIQINAPATSQRTAQAHLNTSTDERRNSSIGSAGHAHQQRHNGGKDHRPRGEAAAAAGTIRTVNESKGHNSKSSVGEISLLELYPPTRILASEWLDGLLMLLNQAPLTAETSRLLKTISAWGLKIRLLNVRFEDESAWPDGEVTGHGHGPGLLDSSMSQGSKQGYDDMQDGAGYAISGKDDSKDSKAIHDSSLQIAQSSMVGLGDLKRGQVPSREGLDEDYYYDVFGS